MIWGRLYEAFWDFIALLKEMLSSRYLPFFENFNYHHKADGIWARKTIQSFLLSFVLFRFISSAAFMLFPNQRGPPSDHVSSTLISGSRCFFRLRESECPHGTAPSAAIYLCSFLFTLALRRTRTKRLSQAGDVTTGEATEDSRQLTNWNCDVNRTSTAYCIVIVGPRLWRELCRV